LVFLGWIDDESIPFIGVFPTGDGDGVNFESFDTDFNFDASVTINEVEQMVWGDGDSAITINIPIGEQSGSDINNTPLTEQEIARFDGILSTDPRQTYGYTPLLGWEIDATIEDLQELKKAVIERVEKERHDEPTAEI
jgi:hypothetical protein